MKTGDRKGVWKMTKDFLPYGAILTTIIQLQFYNQTYTVYLNRTFQYRYKHHQYADWGEDDVIAFIAVLAVLSKHPKEIHPKMTSSTTMSGGMKSSEQTFGATTAIESTVNAVVSSATTSAPRISVKGERFIQ